MIVFLEGLSLSRRNLIGDVLSKAYDVFTIGIVHNRIQKEKYDNITFDYQSTVESLVDMDNITIYLKDRDNSEIDNYFDELPLPKHIVNVDKETDEEIAEEIFNYVYSRYEN